MDVLRVWLKVLQLREVGLRKSMVITDEILVCVIGVLHERNSRRPVGLPKYPYSPDIIVLFLRYWLAQAKVFQMGHGH
jgi:hypothetical protein